MQLQSDRGRAWLENQADLILLFHRPWILGVTSDTHFTFAPHVANVATFTRSQLNDLKALAGTCRISPCTHLQGTHQVNLFLWGTGLVCKCLWLCRCSSCRWPWRWPLGSTLIGRRDSCLFGSCSPFWALNIWPALFTLGIPSRPSSDLLLALEPFATPSSPACSPASSSSSLLMAPSLPLTMLGCFVPCTNQRSWRRSAPSPNRVLGVTSDSPLLTLLKSEEERFLPWPHRAALSQLYSGFSLALCDYLHRVNGISFLPLVRWP